MMRLKLRFASVALLLAGQFVLSAFAGAVPPDKPRAKEDFEAATRLQVFLDRAEFAPGKIDGRYGAFTLKALALYRQAHGGEAAPASTLARQDTKSKGAPDVSGLDLKSIEPVFLTYTVTDADVQSVGELPESVPAQAKVKSLPYASVVEAIAEKFHTDVDFIGELNPKIGKPIKAGDQLTVPNVEPFELSAVKGLQPGSEVAANEIEDAEDAPEPKANGKKERVDEATAAPTTSVKIDTRTNMLTVHEGEKLLAAYPVTIGSERTVSPLGDWKVRGVAKNPNFRYDQSMLNKGERSDHFYMLPPGPNNPVGVLWIALNKKGIGLHGTSDPDSIGRSASHGCVRLANWDVVRLAGKIKAGVPVQIR
jgi:lipoprotein-anchoring transpeptidase ErfK/SrfK